MSVTVVSVLFLIVGVLLVGCACFVYQLMLQNGRILLRLRTLEANLQRRFEPSLDPLPVGSVLNDFELPLLTGGTMTLSQWRGQRLLLVFFDPECRFCQQLASSLTSVPALPTLIISAGDAEKNRALFSAQSITIPVLLQEDDEFAKLCRISGTPSGYIVDENGATAGELVSGVGALLDVIKTGAIATDAIKEEEAPQNGTGRTRLRPASESRLTRDGLRAGTPAPDFTLPQLDGEELSLSAYAGQKILLVFSDPGCMPCMALAPKLEEIHRQSQDLRVLMISRGDVQANRDKVRKLGLTFPVVLQRHWEVSRLYGMFATPIAYLIGENGLLASNVAVGEPGILGLVSSIEKEKPLEQTV